MIKFQMVQAATVIFLCTFQRYSLLLPTNMYGYPQRFFLSRLVMNTVMNLKSFVSNFLVRNIMAKSLKYSKFLRTDFFP